MEKCGVSVWYGVGLLSFRTPFVIIPARDGRPVSHSRCKDFQCLTSDVLTPQMRGSSS
jgi:hypothetical protein